MAAACGGAETAPSTTTAPPPPSTTSTTSTTAPPATTTTLQPRGNAGAAYFVGNSLTGGTLGPITDGVRSYAVLAQQAGFDVEPLGWHIKCSSSLISIAEHPGEVCVDPAPDSGLFEEALPARSWDFLVVQPYPGEGSTLDTDVAVISELAELVSDETVVLVFTGWPKLEGFTDSWNAVTDVVGGSPTRHSRVYFDTLMEELSETLAQSVELIPTAEVLDRVRAELADGAVPGMTSLADLYRDRIHLNELGKWLSGAMTAAVMTRTDPSLLSKPPTPTYGDDAAFPPEYEKLVLKTIAEVLAE